ncbi:tyrosine-type recombinase/integrase [Micromonospora sp. C95]|nr:tyrosine-type recombinase/integrase [Micromonospora sp. C95]
MTPWTWSTPTPTRNRCTSTGSGTSCGTRRARSGAPSAHVAGKRREDLVFTASNGGPLRNINFRPRVFAPAAASVGLAGLTPHDLRHTAASLAVAAGANVKAVQRMRGHASASMTTWTRSPTGRTKRSRHEMRTGFTNGSGINPGKRRSPGR